MTPPKPDRVQVYPSKDGWRWRRLDGNNGDHLSSCDQGYSNQDWAEQQALLLNGGDFIVETVEDEL